MASALVILIFSFTKLVTGKIEGFIVGGDFVDNINEVAHVAFLELTSEDGTVYSCGSSVLTQFLLVTAAHCLEFIKEITAFVGHVQKKQGMSYRVQSFQSHGEYEPATVANDVGLCKLLKPLNLTSNVRRVLLMKNPPRAESAKVFGWGAVEENHFTNSMKLKTANQPLWTYAQCRKVLNKPPNGTICGGQRNATRDFASKGDSGNGLLSHNRFLIGLVSYKDMVLSRSLVVYTDTAYHYDWIQEKAGQLSCP